MRMNANPLKNYPIIKKKYHLLALAFILLVGFFFRFYNTPDRYGFDPDAARDAIVTLEGVKQLQLPQIGPFSSTGPYNFGPWYYYQLILFAFLFQNPYAPWMYMGIISLISILFMYKIGALLENKNFGLLLAGITAVSPAHIIPATGLSNPNLVLFDSILAIWIFIKLVKSKNTLSLWWPFFLGLVLGIGMNNHYQMAVMLVLPLLLFLYSSYKRFHYALITVAGFGISFIPLLFFNLSNHWHTLRGMLFYYFEGRKAIYVPNRWLFYVRDFWPSLWSYSLGVPVMLGIVIALCSLGLIGWLVYKKRLSASYILLFIAFGIQFLALRYFWGERHVYYFYFFLPFIFIFSGLLLYYIFRLRYGRYLGSFLVILLFLLSLPKSLVQLNDTDTHMIFEKEAYILKEYYPDKKFMVYNCKDNYKNRAYAVSFFLNNEKRLHKDGIKIGFMHKDCQYPNTAIDNAYEATPSAEVLRTFYPSIPSPDMVNLSAASDAAILEAGWKSVMPEDIYNSTVRWWFDEKP